jgi:hypothetical protein
MECIAMPEPIKDGPIKGTNATQIPPKITMIDVQIMTRERRIVVLLFDEHAKVHKRHLYLGLHIYPNDSLKIPDLSDAVLEHHLCGACPSLHRV